MQSLIKLGAFLENQNNATLVRIQHKYLPDISSTFTFSKPNPDELFALSFHNIFNYFADQIKAVHNVNALTPIQNEITMIITNTSNSSSNSSSTSSNPSNPSSNSSSNTSSNSKRIRLETTEEENEWNEENKENKFEILPDVLIGEILSYFKFRETFIFERLNRNLFIACRDSGIQFTDYDDLDALIVSAIKDASNIYKFARYQSIKNITIGYPITAMYNENSSDIIRNTLFELMGYNWRIECLNIYNSQLRKADMEDFISSVIIPVCYSQTSSIKELFLSTKYDFHTKWIKPFMNLQGFYLICDEFTPRNSILSKMKAFRLSTIQRINDSLSLTTMDKLESLHTGWIHFYFVEPLTYSVCSKLHEICISDISQFATKIKFINDTINTENCTGNDKNNDKNNNDTTKTHTGNDKDKNNDKNDNNNKTSQKPFFPSLERILISNPGKIFPPNIQKLFKEAPQLHSVYFKSQFVGDMDRIQKMIHCMLAIIPSNIKTMKLAIYTAFGELLEIQIKSLLAIIEDCDERLDEFMISYGGPLEFNLEDTIMDKFDEFIGTKYIFIESNDYFYYRDLEIKRTERGHEEYKSQSFIFRKKMNDAIADSFNFKCNICEPRSIF